MFLFIEIRSLFLKSFKLNLRILPLILARLPPYYPIRLLKSILWLLMFYDMLWLRVLAGSYEVSLFSATSFQSYNFYQF